MPLDPDFIEEVLSQVDPEGNPRLLELPAANPMDARSTVEAWQPLVASENAHREVIRRLWRPLELQIPKTIEMLTRKLRGCALLWTDARPVSLLYVFARGGEFFAHRGFSPASSFSPLARLVPVALDFYNVHDGWVDLYSGDTGPAPMSEWQVLGQEDDGSGGFLELFQAGSSALGFDLSESPPAPHIIWADGDVAAVDDFWVQLDGWMASSLEDFDDDE